MPLGIILLIISYCGVVQDPLWPASACLRRAPQAADSVGINVYKMRYAGVVISGALGAIGGMAYIVPPVQTWNFEVGVAGAGFLAMAVMIFGQWKPFNIFGAAMFFAVFKSLANIADSTFLAQLHWSSNIYNMMPFVASMIILAFTSKNSMAPKAEGIPYDKGPAKRRFVFPKQGRSCFSGRLRPFWFKIGQSLQNDTCFLFGILLYYILQCRTIEKNEERDTMRVL